MTPREIINYARDIKHYLGTNNPYTIASYYGIQVLIRESCIKDFTAQTIKSEKYPTIISINSKYDDFSQRVLCAHELGHALLHSEGINHFAVTSQNVMTNVESEANLFAIALLSDDNIDEILVTPLDRLSGYILKSIMDYNVQVK